MTIKSIKVNLKKNSYPIILDNAYNSSLPFFTKFVPEKKVFVISDDTVAKLYLKSFENFMKENKFNLFSFVFSSGEKYKNLKTLEEIYNFALSAGIDRQYTVIALGGGVVGDTAGFFAATYMRGLNFIQFPTTLLAMVDSSIGGKTGVNIKTGKNIAGAFYQPKFVFINTSFLKTLPGNHIKNGMAEVIKYAISFDEHFFNYLSNVLNKAVLSDENFYYIISKCCRYKAMVVAKDEKEKLGIREFLNFGHTFAHALETITGYKKYLHGQAVAAGMLFIADLAFNIKFTDDKTKQQIYKVIDSAGFIKPKLNFSINNFFSLMKKDKKNISKKIKFVLPKKIGKVVSKQEVDDRIVLKTLKEFFK